MKISTKKRISLRTDKFFCWFIIWFWCENTILPYILQVYEGLPIIGTTHEYVYDIVFFALLIISLPYMITKIKARDTFFYLGCISVVLLTMLLLPKNSEYIVERWYKILVVAIPTYYIGIAYEHGKLKQVLYYVSFASVAVNLLYQIYKITQGQLLISDNMDASYKLLPSIMYLIYMLFEKVSWLHVTSVIMGLVLSFSYGTRGPILAILVFLVLGGYFKFASVKSTVTKALFILGSSVVLVVAFNQQMIVKIASSISVGFERIGFSTRIMDMFLVGEIADDAGRNALAETILKAIAEKPFLGYGLMGDRVILDRYVHNIVLEFICDYGIVLGGIILLVLIGISVRALMKNRHSTDKYFLLAMICMIYIKLSFSGSFVYDPYFYLTIGLCIGACRDKLSNDADGGETIEDCAY